MVMNKGKFAKYTYTVFTTSLETKNATTNQRLKYKWENEIEAFIIGSSTKLILATKSSYFLYLHYRIITRILPTNKLLHIMKVSQTDQCSFCNDAVETLTHLLWFCPKTQIFITEILSHLKNDYNTVVEVNAITWFFLSNVPSISALIITLGKYIIHTARLNGTLPSLQAMINVLKSEALKEYHGYKTRKKIEHFEEKWGELSRIIE